MPIKVLELHHHGIRIGRGENDVARAREFYTGVLGIQADEGRPQIRDLPGLWLDIGAGANSAQLHLMGAAGTWSGASSDWQDPTLPHVALAVEDIDEARRELDRRGVRHFQIEGLVGAGSDQVFVQDPFGNVIELHQIGTCRCNQSARREVDPVDA